jgi:hypothetical protein
VEIFVMLDWVEVAPKQWTAQLTSGPFHACGVETAADAQELYDASLTPAPPLTTVDDVRREAQRRIIAFTGTADIIGCLIKQHNAQMRATELTLIKATGGTWTPEQASEAAALQAMADAVRAIRAASNVLEATLPPDYSDDRFWPKAPRA